MLYQLNLTKSNVEFVRFYYKEQIRALEQFLPLVKDSICNGVPKNCIAFGGGTALAMYYLGHRRSFDIDLFVSDKQYLGFFSPKLWILENPFFNDNYTDLDHHIGVSTKNNIKIDILSTPFIDNPLLDDSKSIFSQNLHIHSIEDIIANKIHFRKAENKTRDIFDIVASVKKYPNLLKNLLAKEAINKDDLSELKTALNSLNYDKYNNEISIIQPAQDYKKIARNAPKILISYIDDCITKIENPTITQKPKIRRR